MGAGIGIVFVILGRRILDRKSGVQGETKTPVSVFHRAGRNEAGVFYLYATSTK